MQNTQTQTKKKSLTGTIISVLCILFLVMDGGMKAFKAKISMDGSAALGWPLSGVQGIGILLLIFTALYSIPRTAVLGAILLTAYLGGATAIMVRAGQPFYFPIIFGVLLWADLFFKSSQLRLLLPFNKEG